MKNNKNLLNLSADAEAGFSYNKSLLNNLFEGTTLEMKRQRYVAPRITLDVLPMEDSIATASAVVAPTDNDGEVKQEWEVENIEKSILW